jgi:hypothetical protein
MCPIPNGFRDRVIPLYRSKTVGKKEILVPKLLVRKRYSSKTVGKKEILHTVSNIGIDCLRDKADTVYPVQYIVENSTVNINAFCDLREGMACCLSECILTFLYAVDNMK